jgi:hypothetical protein
MKIFNRKSLTALTFSLLTFSPLSQAAFSIDIEAKLLKAKDSAQTSFNSISDNLGNVAIYRAVKAPRPMGALIGFDIGADMSIYDITAINDIIVGLDVERPSSDVLPVPKISAHLTLPFGLGLRAFSLPLDSVGLTYNGVGASYAVINGDIGFIAEATYTLAVTGQIAKLKVDNVIEIDSKGGDVVALIGIDLPLLKINPYVGIGYTSATSTSLYKEDVISQLGLQPYDFNMIRTYVGVEVKLGIFIAAAETDQVDGQTTSSIKLGLGFGF